MNSKLASGGVGWGNHRKNRTRPNTKEKATKKADGKSGEYLQIQRPFFFKISRE